MICTQCGTQNPDDGTFCVGCGQALQAAPAPQYAPPPQYAPAAEAPAVDEAQDAQDNKLMGILSYLGFLALIPFLTKKDSPFAQYHAKQGMTLFVLDIAVIILNSILGLIKVTKVVNYGWWQDSIRVTPWYISLVTWLLSIGLLVLAVMGILNAVKGLKKELPLIGKIQIFK